MVSPAWRFLVLWLFVTLPTAAPVDSSGNLTQSELFVAYVSEPNGRGTTSLILSCLLTLVLYVWSALHLNVPEQNASYLHGILCNTRWIITGVYAPELVVFTAWRQWASARLLGQLVAKLSDEGKTKNSAGAPAVLTPAARQGSTLSHRTLYISAPFTDRRHEWTKTHDFFASTGGFAFEVPPRSLSPDTINQPFLPDTCPTRVTLTARGMAKCNCLPDVPERDILDKSKANNLAKALVIIQTSWMLLQTVGRLRFGLPVTLLEVNTIAHVTCVFAIYIFWWHKPLLPNEPFIIDGDWVEPLFAYMYMSSDLSGEFDTNEVQTTAQRIFAFMNWYSKSPEIEHISLHLPKAETTPTNVPMGILALKHAPTSQPCLDELQAKELEKTADTAFFERRPKLRGANVNLSTDESPTARRRWTLALEAIREYPTILDAQTLFNHEKGTCVHLRPEELLVNHVQNWPSDDLLRNVSGLTVGMVLWMASLAYGAIHAAAWNDHFPSVAEQWLWRSSAAYIGFCGGLWIILNYLAQAYRPLNEFWERLMDGEGSWYPKVIIGFLVLLCGSSFILARLYIVVEAVVSIRSLPAAAYDTPDWTQAFPHF